MLSMKEAIKLHELSPAPPPPIREQWYKEDSINLVDLWLELVRYRNILFMSTALALIAGLAIALFTPNKYSYSTAIEIGSNAEETGNGLKHALIDNPETVLAKLMESYIPLALQHYTAQYPDDKFTYNLKAYIPKGSQLIVLEGQGPENMANRYIELLQNVLDNLVTDHRRVTELARTHLQTGIDTAKLSMTELEDPRTLQVEINILDSQLNEARITYEKLRDPLVLKGMQQGIETTLQRAEMELEKLRDPRFFAATKQVIETKLARTKKHLIDMQDRAELIKSRYQRLDETNNLLKKQITELEAQITTTLQRRQQALSGLQNEASAMTMLMVDNEIQQNRLRLAELEERLYIKQQDLRQELEDRLAANQREQGVQQQQLTQLEGDLERLVLENARQQTLQLTHIGTLKGDLKRLTLSNQRAQQLEAPRANQLEEQLAKLRADHARKLTAQRQNIHLLETQLQAQEATRALTAPMQSTLPISTGKLTIIALSLILGLFIGLFAAFFAGFLRRARQQIAEQQ
jgi:hypothetical protein